VGFEVITTVVMKCSGKRDAYMILVENPEGKKPLRKPRHRWGTILKYILEK
jgi:hypothetical protein